MNAPNSFSAAPVASTLGALPMTAPYAQEIRISDRVNRRLEKWDRANQVRAERDNQRLGGDDWLERLNEETPGPGWAWAISGIPFIGWIGDAVILLDSWRRRRRRKRSERE